MALVGAVGVVAYLIGRSVSTPAQQAARTRPPRPSLLTAPVRLTHARTSVVVRGTLSDGGAITVSAPTDLGDDLPVVTSIVATRGAEVSDGSLIAAVAGRPVFVMQGQIPAYSTLSYGSAGVPVSELQTALETLGYSTGSDLSGHYGAGTAAAVAAFYARAGYRPTTTSTTITERSGKHRKVLTKRYASVPLGEVMFTRRLPVDVVSVARLGQTIASGKPIAQLGSGRLTFKVKTDRNTASLLHAGASGHARSDLNGGSFAVRLTGKGPTRGGGVPHSTLTFTPVDGAAAARYVGQNMALHIETGQRGGRQWVVPVSAVVTDASGASSVLVLRGSKPVSVPVHAGLAFNGREVVRPKHGGLAVGDKVVIGVGR